MKIKHLMSSVGLALKYCFFNVKIFPVFAQENVLNNDNQKKNIVTMVSEVGDSETIVSEVLTFDEVVQAIAKDNNISLSEAAYHVDESNYSMNNAQNGSSI